MATASMKSPGTVPRRSPTAATRLNSEEVRRLNNLLTAAGFKGGLRAFIAAVWGLSQGRAIFRACHADVGSHGQPDRSEGAAEQYVRYWLERLEQEQERLGVWFIRARVGGIVEGERIFTEYDCTLLYDAINGMAAPEPVYTEPSIRAQGIVARMRVEPKPIDTANDPNDPADTTANDLARAEKEIAQVLKAIATKRLRLVKTESRVQENPLAYLRQEIDRAKRMLERLESWEGGKRTTLENKHREEEKGETSDPYGRARFAETDEKPQQKEGSSPRFSHPTPPLADLQNFPQWVAWSYVDRTNQNGETKLTKPPINPHTGEYAKVTEPDTWGTFEQAQQHGGNGVGFVLAETDPFAGIDIDHCISETGEIEAWALDIIEALNSYAERSPSKRGVHIFVGGKLPGKGINRRVGGHHIEVYDRERYLTVTGDHIEGTPLAIEYRQDELTELYNRIVDVQEVTTAPAKPAPPVPLSCVHSESSTGAFSDEEVIELASGFKNGDKFERLFLGYASAYKSDSEADQALCSLIAFVTQDAEQIARIFAQSGLWREKWNRADYRDGTIGKALKGLTARYTGRGRSLRAVV